MIGLRGYTDRPSAAPGERLTFHVSCDEPGDIEARLFRVIVGDVNPAGPGPREEAIDAPVNGTYRGISQRTQIGGYVEVPDPDGRLAGGDGLGLHLFVYPTIPAAGRQAVISRWDDRDAAGWALTIEDGTLTFAVGDGSGAVARVTASKRLFPHTWYSVAAGYDPDRGTLTIDQRTVVSSTNGLAGPVVPLAGDSRDVTPAPFAPAAPAVPAVIAGLVEEVDGGGRAWVAANYNGKVDSPRLYRRPPADGAAARLAAGDLDGAGRPFAHWDFAAGIGRDGIGTDTVREVAGGLHGRCVNTPARASTGWNWDGEEDRFVHAPEQYGAIWFHDDSIDDSRWEPTAELTVPDDLRSGCYVLRVTQGDQRDDIPFFVVPPRGTATAPIALLVPTWSYIAYANVRTSPEADAAQVVFAHPTVMGPRALELQQRGAPYGLSVYDLHSDGQGSQYSTWRRPILNLRPNYRYVYDATWNFQSDLHIVGWLERMGFDYDVITDDELHHEGVAALKPYRAVITGSHPEYYSGRMIDAWEEFLAGGGRGMYLGGNGMYWVTSAHPEKPYLLEVRRGESGDQGWRARPGELFHHTTGERGGLWRHRARAPQKVWGTGMTSHMLDTSAPYHLLADAHDPRVDWIFEGVDRGEPLGDYGLIGDGAAGQEVDRYDLALGTPPHALLLGSSYGHTYYDMLVPEDQFFPHAGMNGVEHPLIRTDLVYFTTPNGGAMFAASSMTWSTSLPHDDYDNGVSRVTANVLRRFADEEPLPLVS